MLFKIIFGSHALHECVIETAYTNTVGHFDISQLAPFHWSIRSLVNSHLYCTQVNSILVSDCLFGVSPVNYADPEPDPQYFSHFLSHIKISVISRTVTEDELC